MTSKVAIANTTKSRGAQPDSHSFRQANSRKTATVTTCIWSMAMSIKLLYSPLTKTSKYRSSITHLGMLMVKIALRCIRMSSKEKWAQQVKSWSLTRQIQYRKPTPLLSKGFQTPTRVKIMTLRLNSLAGWNTHLKSLKSRFGHQLLWRKVLCMMSVA